MPLAYRYHRFSSARQDKGASLERQGLATAALCKKHGWDVIETLEDKGRSAWKGDHLRVGELGRFKDRVDAGEIAAGSYLVIENLDRLSRMEVKFARRWIEDVTDKGVIVAVCTPEIILDADALSGDNIVSVLQYLLEAKRSTGESTRKSEMQTEAIKRFMTKARSGIVYSKRAPAWLKGEKDGTFEPIEERVAIVRQIYEWSADGIGVMAIARRLNDTVTPWNETRTRKPKWKHSYVRDILLSPAVEGEYHVRTGHDRTPTGEVILGYYRRIVDADLVERARAAMKQRAGTGGRKRSEAANLFAGRVSCAHCGDNMIRVAQGRDSRNKVYQYLKCARYNDGGSPAADDPPEAMSRKCVNNVHYRYDLFEEAALDRILHLALDDTFFVKSEDISPLAGRVADLKKELERLTARQSRAMAFVLDNDDAEEAKEALNQLRPQVAATKRSMVEALEALASARGKVSPEQHLRRVLEVKDAIHSEDEEERNSARRKVRDAMLSVVSGVECRRIEPDRTAKPFRKTPGREITMILAGGYMAWRFDGHGNELGKISLQGLPDMMKGLVGTGAEQVVDVIAQRRVKDALNR